MMLALAGASGLLLGGVLIHANLAGLGWRAIFLANVPIGLTALVLGSRRIPASAARAIAAASTRPGPRSSPWRCSPSSTADRGPPARLADLVARLPRRFGAADRGIRRPGD
jgi:MFS family permease